MVWVGFAISWYSGAVLAGALFRVNIAASLCSEAFINLTQDTAISWYVDKLYSSIFFCVNGGYWGVSVEA